MAWVSYTGDLRLPIGTAGYEDNEPLGSDIDQTTFDGKHRSLNGYNGVWEVITWNGSSFRMMAPMTSSRMGGAGGSNDNRHWSWPRRSCKAVSRNVKRPSTSFALGELVVEYL